MLAFRRLLPQATKFQVCSQVCSKAFSSSAAPVITPSIELVNAEVIKPYLTTVSHPYSLNGQPIDLLPSKVEEMFAVIEFSGTQFKVTLDDIIIADRIEGIDIDQKLDLSKILMIGSRKATIIGRPYVEGAQVVVSVEEIAKDRKVIIFKMRRRKNSRSLRGFRRQVTVLRVVDIILGDKLESKEMNLML